MTAWQVKIDADELLKMRGSGCWAKWLLFASFSLSRQDARQSLMAAMQHHSTVFLASCASATGADANSCLSLAKMWCWIWCALKTTRHPQSMWWTGPARSQNPVEHCTRQGLVQTLCRRLYWPASGCLGMSGTTSGQVLPPATDDGESGLQGGHRALKILEKNCPFLQDLESLENSVGP